MSFSKLGQNFLINQDVAEREINYANLEPLDTVLEIGPGKGILTKIIAKKVKQVIAVELDKKLYLKLKKNSSTNVILYNEDILNIDFNTLPVFNKVVANLPFQISSPFTFKLLDYPFDTAILIYQKDFAERMIAEKGSKEYSRLSVAIFYKSYCKVLEIIPKNCFNPVPKVDSAIVEIIPRKKPPFDVLDEKFFFNIVKMLFNHRRKKISNIIKDENNKIKNLPFSDNRVEDLSPSQIGKLSDFLIENKFKPSFS
jgi:16S rRNA (adenine1518-N6/adenine1519-N6)-dimethyltransferase